MVACDWLWPNGCNRDENAIEGSVLQNSIFGRKLSGPISSSDFGQVSTQKQQIQICLGIVDKYLKF
jgi:hypothetical protein